MNKTAHTAAPSSVPRLAHHLHSSLIVLAACGLGTGAALAQAPQEAVTQVQAQAQAQEPAQTSTATQVQTLDNPLLGKGRIWLVEDPVLLQPSLSVSATDKVALKDGALEPLNFNVYTNYAAFLKRGELRIFGPRDAARIKPLAVLPVALGQATSQIDVKWDGALGKGTPALRRGDRLQYVLRVYDAQGRWDETRPGAVEIVSDVQKAQSLNALRSSLGQQVQLLAERAGQSLQDYAIGQSNFGNNNLIAQNIPLFGSRVRVRGQDIPEGVQIKVNGKSLSIDTERKFVGEYLMPLGEHRLALDVIKDQQTQSSDLRVNVSGEYWLMVAMADLTHAQNRYSGKIEAVTPEDYERFGGRYTDARVAFYLKGKIKGRYLLTAQADTQERNTRELFKRLFKADRSDLIRRIDPDAYYPVFGDDSTTTQDVDTLGRLYVRLDWDRSSALWGKVKTDFNGNDLAQFNRELYGAKLALRSVEITEHGQAKRQVRAFVAEQQTAAGSSQFWGTGGSLYFLRHADVVPGSQRVELQIRDRDSERVTARYTLLPGRDYELNAFQGRIILSRPLQQIMRDNNPTSDQPGLGSSLNVLEVQYEYYPTGLQQEQISAGLNLRQWFNDTVALGATYVKERRGGQDYALEGVDLTLQKGPQTWIKVEHARSESQQAPVFTSRDGGLSFVPLNNSTQAAVEGNASAVELRLNTQEQGWTDKAVQLAGWVREQDAGFSGAHSAATSGKDLRETGAEAIGQVNEDVQVLLAHKQVQTTATSPIRTPETSGASTGNNELQRTRVGVQWNARENIRVDTEVQRVSQQRQTSAGTENSEAGLAGVRQTYSLSDKTDVYAGVQKSFAEKNYDPNDSVSVGVRHEFAQASSVQVDLSDGDRGQAISVTGEYQRTSEHTIYSTYTHAPRSSAPTASEDLIASRIFSKHTGWTLGQRMQLNSQWRLNQESQWTEDDSRSGQSNGLGLEYTPSVGWTTGLWVQKGYIDLIGQDALGQRSEQRTERQAVSLYGRYNYARASGSSKLERRQDKTSGTVTPSGLTNGIQRQWLIANKLSYKVNDDWRVLGKFDYAITESRQGTRKAEDAKFSDTALGLAWRPRTGGTHLLVKLQHLHDVAPLGQLGSASSQFDQQSTVSSIEGSQQVGLQVELGAKLALRQTRMRLERGSGPWFENDARYAAAQVRWKFDRWDDETQKYDLWSLWSVLGEYRVLDTQRDGRKSGYLVSLDKDMNENLRFGLGYNFTDFSTSLTDLSYSHEGWFLNLLWRY